MPEIKRNHYSTLGVKPDASEAEIKRAYRKLAKTFHPDLEHNNESEESREHANEQMLNVNEAYAILIDSGRRAEYNALIGVGRIISLAFPGASEDEERQAYLHKVFNPLRRNLTRLLNSYPNQLRDLSLDIYDDKLLGNFEAYTDELELALREAADSFSMKPYPRTLDAAVKIMRYSISQAVDGLEEMRHFSKNFNYAHLSTASILLKIACDLSRQSQQLTRL